ncbi:aquaporin [Rhodanobacter spathiphylli]|jgi:glycerol uptake facilitator-like aquaporin|uniref:Major intrinsic protein n=1 Tax=Rhodanobacter spathiphylli B39 TaxID=1163407 RepID=I4W7C7_9GAMM|nr:aquaporin [Rhodanobacter spathiphylli]EIL95368.1 major intrinsic protein [Rhodanobacter spathiphylli B39]
MRTADRFDMHTCFFEHDPGLALFRRASAEFVGTLFLVLVIVGSGILSRRLASTPELALAVSAMATASALAGLIAALGNVSGGHFNPLITFLQWLGGERNLGCTLAYIAGQFVGGILGALLADALFGSDSATTVSPHALVTLGLSEIVASCGLMILVFGCSRSGRASSGPFAVAAWLMSAIVATPSASYANPAVTVSATFAFGPVALPSGLAILYLPAEVAGALIAFAIIAICYPRVATTVPADYTEESSHE